MRGKLVGEKEEIGERKSWWRKRRRLLRGKLVGEKEETGERKVGGGKGGDC